MVIVDVKSNGGGGGGGGGGRGGFHRNSTGYLSVILKRTQKRYQDNALWELLEMYFILEGTHSKTKHHLFPFFFFGSIH